MSETLREQMLASATDAVNALCTFAQDQPQADFDAREERVLQTGRALLATWLGQLASAAGPRTPACPNCGVHSLNAVRRRRQPRTMNSRCGTVHISRVRLTCRGCRHSWLPLEAALGVGAQQRTSGGLQHWEALVGGLTIFAEATQLLETLAGVQVGTGTLRTHAEAAGTELEGQQRAAMAHVQATQEPPPGYAPVAQTLVVEADGVMARYRDHHLDGTLIKGEWHEIKLGLVGDWQDGQLVNPSYVAARETASSFAPRLGTEAARRGALDIVGWRGLGTDGGGQEAVLRRVVVIGDGAKWIWEHVATLFDSARVEILDWFHCCQHVWDIGAAVHGDGTTETAAWVDHAKDLLWERGPAALLALLATLEGATAEARKVLATERGYFRTNAQRMHYSTYREQGWPIGSGAVESAAKHLVQQRMKRGGGIGEYAKLNLKPPSKDPRFEWHQDYPFFSHTNFDLLAVMIMLDDSTEENRCLKIIPGSHKWGQRNHLFARDGAFSSQLEDRSVLEDPTRWKTVPLPLHEMELHHCNMLHSSGPTRGVHPRSAIVIQHRAADNVALGGNMANFGFGLQIRGTNPYRVRMMAGTFRLPGQISDPLQRDG